MKQSHACKGYARIYQLDLPSELKGFKFVTKLENRK